MPNALSTTTVTAGNATTTYDDAITYNANVPYDLGVVRGATTSTTTVTAKNTSTTTVTAGPRVTGYAEAVGYAADVPYAGQAAATSTTTVTDG